MAEIRSHPHQAEIFSQLHGEFQPGARPSYKNTKNGLKIFPEILQKCSKNLRFHL